MIREVEFYHAEGDGLICDICPHHCKFKDDDTGICRGRKRINDRLIAVNYAQTASMCIDPIEKKPLYHFRPGSVILSIGANGCNLQCAFCQNSEISQGGVPTHPLPIEDLVKAAGSRGSIGAAFTYSEPLIWYEYVLDGSKKLRENGLISVLVSNGFIEEEPLRRLLPAIDAMNIDLKSLNNDFYRRLCKADVAPVKRAIRMAYEAGVHLEITHLVVSGWNDKEESIAQLSKWIASIDDEIPLHLSRYFPHYRCSNPPTSSIFLQKALQIAKRELKFVYLGNISVENGADTMCPRCNSLIVRRSGYSTEIKALKDNACGICGCKLPFK